MREKQEVCTCEGKDHRLPILTPSLEFLTISRTFPHHYEQSLLPCFLFLLGSSVFFITAWANGSGMD